jgi:hypothetical protein
MRVWLALFLILFIVAELFDWVKEFTLPLPIYILGGAFLAVASNYNQMIGSFNKVTKEALQTSPQLEAPGTFTKPISGTIPPALEDTQVSDS